MTEIPSYFERAGTWAITTQELNARSRRIAWIIAGVAAAIAAFEAVALAMLVPLKTVQPITLLVDRQTGYVQAVDPFKPARISADDALTQSFLAQYVSAREGFDRATVSWDYRRVALWSAGKARSTYLAAMPATNPASPFRRYAPGTVATTRVKSVSKLAPGTALVRFDSLRQDPNGGITPPEPWVAVIRYRFVDAPMQMEDRLLNPLGFQVLSYRKDAEAAPAPVQEAPGPRLPAETVANSPSPASPAPRVRPTHRSLAAPRSAQRTARRGAGERNNFSDVPQNSLPMGSPLDPPGAQGQ